ncbi:MAG: ABC transporter permease [Chloroflexi bacterium]|nr:ABC transporter permease [Chloroflexota bacterium]
MNKIIAIIWKDTKIRFTGLTEWLFFLILPILFTLVLAGGSAGSGDDRVRLVVVDQAQSQLSANLIAALQDSGAVRPDVQPLNTAENQFNRRQVAAVLTIPSGLNQETLQQGSIALELRKQPNNTNALVAEQAVMSVIDRASAVVDIANRSVAEAEVLRPFASSIDRQAWFDASLLQAQTMLEDAPQRIAQVTGNTPDQIEYNPLANSSAGQIITWVFIPLIGISGMFAYERQKGTLRRLLTTPTSKATFLFGTILGQVLSALVQMLLLVGFGILVMKLDWARDPAALALILVSSALAAAALGTALGTFVKTEAQASGLSILMGMVMAMLGGCWYPIELFPQIVRTAVKILPTTWAMEGMLDILVRGKDALAVLPTAGVLLGFAALFFTVGIVRFRYE